MLTPVLKDSPAKNADFLLSEGHHSCRFLMSSAEVMSQKKFCLIKLLTECMILICRCRHFC
jgi:hypothetical protein